MAVVIIGISSLFLGTIPANAYGCGIGNTTAQWSSTQSYTYLRGDYCLYDTWPSPNRKWEFRSDGNLTVRDARNDSIHWQSGTSGRGYALKFATDGNVVIYNSSWVPIFSLKQSPLYFNVKYVLWLFYDCFTQNYLKTDLSLHEFNRVWIP